MTDVYNLDAWIAESRREPFRFQLGGKQFAMPAAAELDKSVLSSVNLDRPSASDIETLMSIGLGDQWPEFNAQPAPLGALGELFKQWQRHEGVTVGESSASTDS